MESIPLFCRKKECCKRSWSSHGSKLQIWILVTFESRDSILMLALWKSLIIPRMEYCSQLWSPSVKGLIQELEILQKTFVKKISGAYKLNYWELLNKLKLFSLERRRECYQIIYVWKILEELVPNFTHAENGDIVGGIGSNVQNRLGRKCTLPTMERGSYQSIRANSLAFQGPRLFNCLPKSLHNPSGCSVSQFKAKLDKFLQTVPDEPQVYQDIFSTEVHPQTV